MKAVSWGANKMIKDYIHMLVADDSATCRAIFRDCATGITPTIRITEARDGRECMKYMSEDSFDMAFIDLHMPEANGLEALDTLRKRGDKTFTVLMSSMPIEQIVEVARKLSAYDFLHKPFRQDAILAIVRNFERIRKPMRALLVDDSATMRKIVSRILDQSIFNMQIEECESGVEALERVEARHYDLIFLDYNMPGLNGAETFIKIREMKPRARLILTSTEEQATIQDALGSHHLDIFLRKPFFPVQLDYAVHSLLGMRHTFQANSMMTASTARLSPGLT